MHEESIVLLNVTKTVNDILQEYILKHAIVTFAYNFIFSMFMSSQSVCVVLDDLSNLERFIENTLTC